MVDLIIKCVCVYVCMWSKVVSWGSKVVSLGAEGPACSERVITRSASRPPAGPSFPDEACYKYLCRFYHRVSCIINKNDTEIDQRKHKSQYQ